MADKKKPWYSKLTGITLMHVPKGKTLKEEFHNPNRKGITFFHAKNKKDFKKKSKLIENRK